MHAEEEFCFFVGDKSKYAQTFATLLPWCRGAGFPDVAFAQPVEKRLNRSGLAAILD